MRAWAAQSLRSEYGDTLPGGLTPEQAAPLLVAVMDGLRTQWLHDPGAVDMPAAFRDFVAPLTAPHAADGTPGTAQRAVPPGSCGGA